MRLINNIFNEEYSCKTLFLDDITKIYYIIKEISTDEELSISANNYYIDNIEEINDTKFDKIKYLYIKSDRPNLEFKYKYGSTISLSASENSTKVYGSICRIKDIIKSRTSLCGIMVSMQFNAIGGALTYILLQIIISIDNYPKFFANSAVIMFLYFFAMLLNSFRNSPGYNKVVLKSKKNSPNFIKRNIDNIIIGTITLLIGWWLGKYH